MITSRSQRWRARRACYVDNLSVINPHAYAVDSLEPATAKAFIAEHHYLPNYPAAKLAVGLFGPAKGGKTALAGVAVFAVPPTAAVITSHTGLTSEKGCTLARLILHDEVAGNGESFFIARALKILRSEKPEIEAVVSYSDPLHGHLGLVYCATNAAYRGRSQPRTAYLLHGQAISGRTLSKIRLGEQGVGGAIDQLVAAGAPKPTPNETSTAWLARLARERILTRSQHPGLYTYCFELSRTARKAGRSLPRRPYPKVIDLPAPQLPFAA